MPSFVQVQKIIALPKKMVHVYGDDQGEKKLCSFGVTFKALKKRCIDSIINKLTDDDGNGEYGVTDALNEVVHEYHDWTDLPTTLLQIEDSGLKNAVKTHFNITDEEKELTKEHITYFLNVGLDSQYSDAVWIMFLDTNNTQASVFAERNRRKSKRRG